MKVFIAGATGALGLPLARARAELERRPRFPTCREGLCDLVHQVA